MYYSKKVRASKVEELKSNQEFMEHAQKEYEVYKRVDGFGGYNTFEEFLLGDVFDLYESFSMLELLKNADRKTINRAMDIALADL